MVFCNEELCMIYLFKYYGHNPYFNRWFSAIDNMCPEKIQAESHNPYFNRWFSAISLSKWSINRRPCHNPYFNRWFSAIKEIQK